MRWLSDECVDVRIAAFLRSHGHDVIHALDVTPTAQDIDVMNLALREGRLLLTEDKDFGDLAIRRGIAVPGIVLLRVQPDLLSFKCAQLNSAIVKFGETLIGQYVVVEARRFRSRPLPSTI
jgi:predicted nuclease of predicted toxin-antitoxin system